MANRTPWNHALGRRGEDLAAEHLIALGCTIAARNWRCRLGEIDIVALDRAQVVIVEVKTRSSADLGHPFEAIGARKTARLYRLGWAFCASHGMRGRPMRVDAIGVLLPAAGRPAIEHLEGIC